MLWEIWWENPCIFHAMKYIIGWESNRKKHPYYGKSMSTNFPGSPHTMGFAEYYWEPISQSFPIQWFWLSFPVLQEIDEKTHAFPMWWIILYNGNLMGKSTHTMWRVWVPISQVLPIWWVLLHFPEVWEVDGETHVFPNDEVCHRMGI